MAQVPAGVGGQQSTESNDTGQDIKFAGVFKELAVYIMKFKEQKETIKKLQLKQLYNVH